MNLLITPLLVTGLLVNPSPGAGVCTPEPVAAPGCEHCVKVNAHGASSPLDRQARKHAEFYRMLVRAQQDAGAEREQGRQFSVHTENLTPANFQSQ